MIILKKCKILANLTSLSLDVTRMEIPRLKMQKASKFKKNNIFPISTGKNTDKFIRRRDHSSTINLNLGKTIKLVKQIKLLIKIGNMMKFRTKFRTLNNVTEEKIEVLNDLTYFPAKKEKKHFLKQFTEKNVSIL